MNVDTLLHEVLSSQFEGMGEKILLLLETGVLDPTAQADLRVFARSLISSAREPHPSMVQPGPMPGVDDLPNLTSMEDFAKIVGEDLQVPDVTVDEDVEAKVPDTNEDKD